MTETGEPETAGDAKRAWPNILNVNEIQRGRNPAWWKKTFPRMNPVQALKACRDSWGWFWNAVFPRGFMIAERIGRGWRWMRGGVADGSVVVQDWKGVEASTFKEFVSGRLADTDPSAVGIFSGRLHLYWGLK